MQAYAVCVPTWQSRAVLLQIVPGFRVGIVPVLGTMPSMFGMAAASHILCQLAEQPFNPEPIMEVTTLQFETQMARLLEREETKFGDCDSVAVDYNDVRLVSHDMHYSADALHTVFHQVTVTQVAPQVVRCAES